MNLLLIYIVVIGGIFIFMTSRGNRKRQAQAAQMQTALVVGAEVRTIGGMVGEVVEVTDEHVLLETTPGVRLKFIKSAVAGVLPPAEPEAGEHEVENQTEAGTEPEDGRPENSVSSSRVEAALSRHSGDD
ncbi:preprotein translocase subunit YajC [Actinocrinis puniceicyclus]|uniref:Preprotein translocase subunit YajC n=1 Tax=Actinocrinis puniceicyclus TaxID=977794 RepID=A0A8J7WRA5_9ACTN|nr:preprotein translocase subunit YajC [Actinocrinis puniceicyclus]MBS2965210.1 preprotein translocase subunit YajC [Actinocrinis puniceicyclus]